MRRSVIVIGAGVAGLAATVRLAARGIDVTLIERHDQPGGKIHQGLVGGHHIDAGPTVFTLRHVFDELYQEAGVEFESQVSLHPVHVLARHRWSDGSVFDLHQNVEQTVEAIAQLSGRADADAYRAFADRTQAVFNTLDAEFMQAQLPTPWSLTRHSLAIGGWKRLFRITPFNTLWSTLCTCFQDPKLRQLFARYATYCGSSPFASPATLMLIAHAERAGVWTLQGGMQSLANSLLALARTCGGECRFGEGMGEIHTRANRVTGVTLDSGIHLPADSIVFCGDTKALESGLHGTSATRAARTRTPASLSAITRCELASASGFKLSHHNVFFCDDYRQEFTDIFDRRCVPRAPTVYVCAQDRTAVDDTTPMATDRLRAHDAQPDSPERLFCLINAPARRLSEREIAAGHHALASMLSAHGLRLHNHQASAFTENPNDFAERYPGSQGALYGRPTHGAMAAFRRPGARTPIAGLYLAGGTVHPGAGVPMAALSGRHAAECVIDDLNRNDASFPGVSRNDNP